MRSVAMMALLKCAIFALAAVLLAGCASRPIPYNSYRMAIAWDGLGRSPEEETRLAAHKSARLLPPKAEAAVEPNYETLAASNVEPYSKEWWALREAADRVADKILTRKLVICRGCLPIAKDEDATGSIAH
jgi:hypothetical protein